MQFIVDEDLPRRAVELLRSFGHDTLFVKDLPLKGSPDPKIAEYASQQGRAIVTGDLGFADIRKYPPEQFHGIVLVRRRGDVGTDYILELLTKFCKQEDLLKSLSGKLIIVDKEQIRVRLQHSKN